MPVDLHFSVCPVVADLGRVSLGFPPPGPEVPGSWRAWATWVRGARVCRLAPNLGTCRCAHPGGLPITLPYHHHSSAAMAVSLSAVKFFFRLLSATERRTSENWRAYLGLAVHPNHQSVNEIHSFVGSCAFLLLEDRRL